MSNSIYVTGITGFIGSNLLPLLLNKYDYVINFSRDNLIEEYSKSGVKKKDIRDFYNKKYIGNFFINLATTYNPNPKNIDEFYSIIDSNINFPISLIEKFEFIRDLKMINTSSYFQLLDPSIQNEYSLSKEIFINFAYKIFDEVANIHLFDTFGNNDKRNKVVDVFIKNIKNNKPIVIPENEININLSNVDDVVFSIAENLNIMKYGNFIIRSENNITLCNLAKKLSELMGKEVEIVRSKSSLDYLSNLKTDLINIYSKKIKLTFDEQLMNQIKNHI